MRRFQSWAAEILTVVLACGATAWAADVSLTADDAVGTSSFNSAGKWSNSAAPSAGNNYFNANFLLRTPGDANNYTFGGDSLTITSDAAIGVTLTDALIYKGSASSTITINNLTVNGGNFRHASSEAQTFTLAGNGLTVGPNGMGVHVQGPTILTAPVFGSGEIKIVDNGSTNTARTLHFASAANTFNGSINLVTASRSRFALDNGANLNFVIGASGTNNKVYGAGVATFDGVFKFDLTAAGTTLGDTWLVVDVATVVETFSATFSVAGFADLGNNTWATTANGVRYMFNEATGTLSVVPPNFAPTVNAGADQTILLTSPTATLSGTVTDDGQPNPPAAVNSLWTVDSQPAGSKVVFGDDKSPATTVTVDLAGVYVLRLSACDSGLPGACSGLEAADTMTLTVEPHYIWDGGDATSDNWSLAGNWVTDMSPVLTGGATTLTFTGTTRLTPNNDVAGADVKSIEFDAAAGAFQITGQGLTVRSAIRNSSANAQSIGTGHVELGAAEVALVAAADVAVTGAVTGAGGVRKGGAGGLTLSSGLNNYRGYTTVDEGPVTISSATGLGLGAPDFAGMTFVDAAGTADGIEGNTVRYSDGNAISWLTAFTAAGDNLWYRWTNSGVTFLESGPAAENTDLLKTTISGLTVGETYTLGVVYWVNPGQNWVIRAGLAPDQLTLFNYMGGVVAGQAATPGSTTGLAVNSLGAFQVFAILGTGVADANGQVAVYVDDLPTGSDTNRCWYDGLVYQQGVVPAGAGTLIAGGTSKAVLQLTGGFTSPEQVSLGGRQPSIGTAAHIRNLAGNNALVGETVLLSGGSEYFLESLSGQMTLQAITANPGLANPRNIHLYGDGNGLIGGPIHSGVHGSDINILKEGAGVWALTGNSPDVDTITVSGGTLALASSLANNVPDATLSPVGNAVLDVTGLSNGGGIVLSAANAQTLMGTGFVRGKVTVDKGTTVAPGLAATPGTLTLTNGVTFADGSIFKVRLGTTAGDLLRITGGVLTGSNTGGISLNIDPAGAPVGTYTLIDWSGATASGLDPTDFVATGVYSPCLAVRLRIDGSKLVMDYNGGSLTGVVDDFESYAAGRVDALVGAPWKVIPSTGSQFVNIVDDNGNSYLGVQMYNVTGTNGRGTYRPLGCYRITDGQTRTLFFRWLAADVTSLNHYIGLTDSTYAPTSTSATDVDDMRVRLRLTPGTGGAAFQYNNGTEDVIGRNGLLANTWYNVWVVIRNNAGATGDVCDYYINTGLKSAVPATDLVAANVPFRGQVAADLVNFSVLAWLSTAQNIVRIDDINVLDGETLNNPLLTYGGFDFNGDGYVDSIDWAVFASCVTGPSISGPPEGCSADYFARCDSDGDRDVDQVDFGAFQRCFSGITPGDPNCGS